MKQDDVNALSELARLLLERAGLKITPDGFHGLRLALKARLPALGLADADAYVRHLTSADADLELRALLPLVTVGKTEFFRDAPQFASFCNGVLPQVLARARAEHRVLRIWCAGCATGEEAYSLAMVAVEAGALESEVQVIATDINPKAVETASGGFYSRKRLAGVDANRLRQFFVEEGNGFKVASFLRGLVHFESHNLAQAATLPALKIPFDVIFCRNVLIYFDQATIEGVINRFEQNLVNGGWLFLGYSETLFKVRTRFHMKDVLGTFVYQRDDSVVDFRMTPLPQRQPIRVNLVQQVLLPAQSLERRAPPFAQPTQDANLPRSAHERPPERAVGSAAADRVSRQTGVEQLEAVVALIDEGDFEAAETAANRLLAAMPDDLAAALTLGSVHAVQGKISQAKACYETVLAREPLCVEALVYSALASFQGGHFEEAKAELGKAIFLEPNLSLSHYLMGMVLEKLGQVPQARRSYRNAIAQRLKPAHVLVGHFPDVPTTNQAIATVAQYRLAALSENDAPSR